VATTLPPEDPRQSAVSELKARFGVGETGNPKYTTHGDPPPL